MKLGEFELHIVSDGSFRLDGGAMFGIVPRTLWERHVDVDEKNRVRLALNCLYVRTPGHQVLIDTGIGNKFDAKWNVIYDVDRSQTLVGSLARLGVRPEDIDTIIHTHLHFDHAGGNTTQLSDGRIVRTFPNACCYAQQGEFDHALAPFDRDRPSYALDRAKFMPPYCEYELLQGDQEVVPGIRVAVKPGHNRFMQIVEIESQGEKGIVFSDLVSTQFHLNPQWITSFDLFPLEVIENKRPLIEDALREHWLCVFYHDMQCPMGFLAEQRGKIVAEPPA
ncbi:MAG: MBL fold metallo-hydrolase [Acidobacteriia bacterium]|nr:MBL fold metallo-hydrolase [Terriglobia bacterium]